MPAPGFWGGEKDKWENGKKVGKETVEGWYKEMCWKTVYRAAYGNITIDSQKIDDDFLRLREMETTIQEAKIAQEIADNANGEVIDIKAKVINEDDKPGAEPPQDNGPVSKQQPPAQDTVFAPTGTDGAGIPGPGF